MSNEFEKFVRTGRSSVFPDVKIGYRSYVNDSMIRSGTTIGRYCSIGRRCTLNAGRHPTDWLSTHPYFFDPEYNTATLPPWDRPQRLDIGNDVWIGDNVVVLNGLTIGDGAIIGAGSIVTKDVPSYAIYAGAPARLLRHRFAPKTIGDLLDLRWWDYEEALLVEVPWNDISKSIQLLRERIDSGRYKIMPEHIAARPEKAFRMPL
jgi:acetyltransferase-like isoleucine patch superfamily enzyme